MKTSAATVNCTPSQAVLASCAWLDLTHTCRFRDEAYEQTGLRIFFGGRPVSPTMFALFRYNEEQVGEKEIDSW
jgi:hypothetical protein